MAASPHPVAVCSCAQPPSHCELDDSIASCAHLFHPHRHPSLSLSLPRARRFVTLRCCWLTARSPVLRAGLNNLGSSLDQAGAPSLLTQRATSPRSSLTCIQPARSCASIRRRRTLGLEAAISFDYSVILHPVGPLARAAPGSDSNAQIASLGRVTTSPLARSHGHVHHATTQGALPSTPPVCQRHCDSCVGLFRGLHRPT